MHGTDVVFLGVSVDEAKDKQKWLDFIETEGLKGIQLLANGWSKITKDYKICLLYTSPSPRDRG